MPVVEVVVSAGHVILLVLLGLLLLVQVTDSAIHTLLEAEVLRIRVHQRLRCLRYRYGSVLGLTGGGGALDLPGVLRRTKVLLDLALAHVLREATVLNVLVYVLAHWLRAVLFVKVL